MLDLAVVLYFDDKTRDSISSIQADIYKAGTNSNMLDHKIPPHITLASWFAEGTEEYIDYLHSFSKSIAPFRIQFSSVGIFMTDPSVVYLSPVQTDVLRSLHQSFYKYFGDKVNEFSPYYLSSNWVPHCTLATKLTKDEVSIAIGYLSSVTLPIIGNVDKIGLVLCNPFLELVEFALG